MKKGKKIDINFEEKKIIVSRVFYMDAGVYRSAQNKQLNAVMAAYPGYQVCIREIKKNYNKRKYKNLDYKHMREFIKLLYPDNPERLDELEKQITQGKGQDSPYAYVKRWFLSQYKDQYLGELKSEAVTVNA